MIDLHAHTDASDGTLTAAELVQEAVDTGLEALAVTDHDILLGYDEAAPVARAAGLELICGIELSTKLRAKLPHLQGRSVHLLGYFLLGAPSTPFREWLRWMQESRRDRNRRLIERLRGLGLEITLEEVQSKGKTQTARPHFAQVLVEKGYVATPQQAFDDYLDESAKGYVQRAEPTFEEGCRRIREAGGLTSLPHPVRVTGRPEDAPKLAEVLPSMIEMGLQGIEAYHSDHGPAEVELYEDMARRFGLGISGGSDFHGATKPGIRLGTGLNGNVHIGRAVLDRLRELAAHSTRAVPPSAVRTVPGSACAARTYASPSNLPAAGE